MIFFLSFACVPEPVPDLSVKLATPTDGSEVDSLDPVLSWSGLGGATSYRLQVASDSNFQQLVIDANDLSDVVYNVPSGKLENNVTYYWRVNASKGNLTSAWSSAWRFKTPGAQPAPPPPPTPPSSKSSIQIIVTLDGSPWSGGANYRVTGPQNFSGASVPQVFGDLPAGEYALTYKTGGPAGATLASITPSPSQTLQSDGTISFTLNFHSQSTSTITINATLNGKPWSGQVNYTINGPFVDADSSVPKTLSSLPGGTYTLSYNYGGPDGTTLANIAPSPTQSLSSGGAIVYTLNFYSQPATGNIVVNATLDEQKWSGPVDYTISGPFTDRDHSVPQTFKGVAQGYYAITYNGDGPHGAILSGIQPSAGQTLQSGSTITFTLVFTSQQTTGTITVTATLDDKPWQTAMGSGPISYTIVGPATDSGSSIPESFDNQPTGKYTCQYNSGGPIGATFSGITPSPTQSLPPNGQITYTLNFHEQEKGTVVINATLNGQPWSGNVAYVVQGPYVESGSAAPQSLGNTPAGTYSVTYSSGGPPSSVFEGVSPPTQSLQPGSTITFTLMFTFKGVLPPPPTAPPPPEN